MITVNISGFEEVRNKIASINMNDLCFRVAKGIKEDIHKRVHVEGLASDGSQIGEYSETYMKVRTGNYPENAIKRGKNKGKFQENKSKGGAGIFTRGARKGQPRPVYNRKDEKKVILSLTSEMEQDFLETQLIPIENGYGIGFSKDFSYDKAIWNEKRYGKTLWALSKEEDKHAHDIVSKYVDEINS